VELFKQSVNLFAVCASQYALQNEPCQNRHVIGGYLTVTSTSKVKVKVKR
jgi:hypothetical protein